MNEIIKFDFHGDNLDVIRDEHGGIHLSLRRMCDNLGLAFQPQIAKLQEKPWATITMIVTVAEDGKSREMACLALKSVPMWLATIETSRVAEAIRPKLERYQCECADCLYERFMGKPTYSEDILRRLAAIENYLGFGSGSPALRGDLATPGRKISSRAKVIDGKKSCSFCHQMRDLDCFAPNPQGAGGRYSICRACHSFKHRDAYKAAFPPMPNLPTTEH